MPGFTVKSSPATAVFSPYLLVSCCASIIRVPSFGLRRALYAWRLLRHAKPAICRIRWYRGLNTARQVVPGYYSPAGGGAWFRDTSDTGGRHRLWETTGG
ncbi:hypothetical protein TNCT6_03050 [Streptomyces sp. 6-11-2]|nr:hypothetical protein TNCT6_03050 [Streptomyces sp. 6-11-2]